MRILAIRGSNLASLAGVFEVDFSAEPLAETGLFAISGPTGAGKSTLLDAMCLALYDTTPRLTAANARQAALPDGSEQSLSQNDPRNLLRRGCAEGYAEVDFAGSDGQSCRARWSVRRARGRVEGRLQATELTLQRLADGQMLGDGTKTGVLRDIEQRVGLSFEQFRRAVLLAQNEFHGFLKAADDERALLLETLTGTEAFADISRRCFERYREQQRALESLQQRIGDQLPLDANERAVLDAELSEAQATLNAREADLQTLQAALDWQRRLQQARSNETAAHSELQAALDAIEQSAPQREQLARIETARDAATLVQQAQGLQQRLTREREALTGLDEARQAAEYTLTQRQQLLQQQLDQASQVQARAQTCAAPLQEARRLDALLIPATAEFAAAQKQQQDARAQQTTAQAKLVAAVSDLAALRDKRQAILDWQDKHRALAALAEQAGRCESRLEQLLAMQTQQRALREQLQTLRAALTDAEQAANASRQTVAQHELALPIRQAAEQQARANLDAMDAARIDADDIALEAQRQKLERAENDWRHLDRLARETALWQQEHADLASQSLAQGTAVDTLQARRPAALATMTQAAAALRTVSAACESVAEQLRGHLIDGEPCPVCGAAQHPYASAALEQSLQQLREQHAHAETQLRELDSELARHSATLEQHQRRSQWLQQQLEAAAPELAAARQAWQSSGSACPPQQEAGEWLALQRQSLHDQRQHLNQHRRAAEAARQALEAAGAALTTSRLALADSQRQSASDEAVVQRLRGSLADQEPSLQALDRDASQLTGTLTPLLDPILGSGWPERLEPAMLARLHSRIADWKRGVEKLSEVEREISDGDRQQQLLSAESAQAEQLATNAGARASEREQALHQLQAQRAAILADTAFAGLAVDDIEARLLHERQQIEAAVDAARRAVEQAGLVLAQAAQARNSAQTAIAQLKQEWDSAESAIDLWLTTHAGWTRNELYRQLSVPTHDIDALRRSQEAQARRLAQAEALVAERLRLREQLAAERPGAEPVSEEQLKAVQQQLAAARNHHGERLLRQREDDTRRQRSAELKSQIEQQTATYRLWAQLNDLIGSSDGKKFRNIGQQLTLDVLLAHANLHLRELARRYRLERIPESLALMVIDQDMADERRSVHSLSGGESFLLSLALALGLASLSSQRVRVESLFIDEGFGSLDAETLAVAMDALDALHAQGRKVGVISHVQEMTERIPVRIQVSRRSGGASRVSVLRAQGAA